MIFFNVLTKIFSIFLLILLVSCGGGSIDDIKNDDSSTPPVDTTPPVEELLIDFYSPNTDEDNVSVDTIIDVTFDKDILISPSDIYLKLETENTEIQGTLALKENNTLTFIPNERLKANQYYKISVTSSSDLSQNISPFSWTFHTEKIETVRNFTFFPKLKEAGSTTFTLNPIEKLTPNKLIRVSFGVPFPKGFLKDIENFKILDSNGIEVPIASQMTLLWQGDKSIRSILVQLESTFVKNEFNLLTPQNYTLEWGEARTSNALALLNVRDTWDLVDDDNYPASLGIFEPKAYAVFKPSWYGDSVIKSRLLPLNFDSDFSASDVAFKLFGDTAINHVDPRVIDDNLIPHQLSYASWLFDRAMAIYQLAFRSGEFKYLRAAHRAAQFYQKHINDLGFFSLKPSNDMKYSYGESLVANYILSGDERIPATIEKMIPVWEAFNTEYTLNSNFWTERHAAYQLFGLISAYELFGTLELENKIKNIFAILRKMQIDPAVGIPKTGALMHTSGSHSEGGTNFIASPWMSAMLISAVERYYLQFEDPDVIDFVIQMANFFMLDDIALHEWKGYQGKDSYYVPRYLAGVGLTSEEHGGGALADLEHSQDVTKIFSLAYFFSCKTECNDEYLKTIAKLNNTVATFGFPHWIRTSAPKLGLSAFRLAPPRKFNWWFVHTANNSFLIGDNTELPFYKDEVPKIEVEQTVHFDGYFKPGDEITVTYKIKNMSTQEISNVVLLTNISGSSPEGLINVISLDELGIIREGEIAWKFDKLSPNETIESMEFKIKINKFDVLQSPTRPLGSIVSYATVSYCNPSDNEPNCILPTSDYDLGAQSVHIQSKWSVIAPVPATTPPSVSFLNLVDDDVLEGDTMFSVKVEDSDPIHHVDFYLDNERLATLEQPPYELSIQTNALSISSHKFTVKAFDIYGSEAIESIIFSAKNPDITAPLILIHGLKEASNTCEKNILDYEIFDDYEIENCQFMLDDIYIIDAQCSNFKIPDVAPLFSANAVISFESEEATILSNDEVTLVGTTNQIERTLGYVNQGAYFGGNENFIEFGQSDLSIQDDLTVSFWIKPSADESVLISQDWYYIGIEQGWAISLGANNHESNNPLSITWSSGDNKNNLNTKNVVQTESNAIKLGEWQHVLVRKNKNLIDIYINGEFSISKTIEQSEIKWPYDSKKLLSIGKGMKHPTMYSNDYMGTLDEVTLWNYPIDDSDIHELFMRSKIEGIHSISITATDSAANRGYSTKDIVFDACPD